jgi:hypothetical protein
LQIGNDLDVAVVGVKVCRRKIKIARRLERAIAEEVGSCEDTRTENSHWGSELYIGIIYETNKYLELGTCH